MNTIGQRQVLKNLTQQAQCFHQAKNICLNEDGQHSRSIDETGPLDTSRIFLSSSELEIKQQKISESNAISVPEEILQVHGFAPSMKVEGIVRLVYENVNGFCNRMSNNKKIEWSKELHNEHEVDIAA
jgi:hypothetical protein